MTHEIDEQLLREAKQLAARSGKALTSLIEDALRESLSRQRGSGHREPVRLVTLGDEAYGFSDLVLSGFLGVVTHRRVLDPQQSGLWTRIRRRNPRPAQRGAYYTRAEALGNLQEPVRRPQSKAT